MEKTIKGNTYKLVEQTDEEKKQSNCGGCVGIGNPELCLEFPECYISCINKVWKEQSNINWKETQN